MLSLLLFVLSITPQIYCNVQNPIMGESLFKYFPQANGDGLNIVWSHNTDNWTQLHTALSDPNILMIESDVILRENTTIPVMAHPPVADSNVTFYQWLLALNQSTKGMKLDCKSLLAEKYALMNMTAYTQVCEIL